MSASDIITDCSVCLQEYDDPASLPCGHVYCKKCITDVVNLQDEEDTNTGKCPECRREFNLLIPDSTHAPALFKPYLVSPVRPIYAPYVGRTTLSRLHDKIRELENKKRDLEERLADVDEEKVREMRERLALARKVGVEQRCILEKMKRDEEWRAERYRDAVKARAGLEKKVRKMKDENLRLKTCLRSPVGEVQHEIRVKKEEEDCTQVALGSCRKRRRYKLECESDCGDSSDGDSSDARPPPSPYRRTRSGRFVNASSPSLHAL
ncbi:hypothetical protein DFP72DRAFT_1170900 [Ephemerocybe angulata]|uniref:RING-type domain-containing protein n=1 Tax=Ephemerocybe angulata TaxID=980116 RepID=A0A8H6M3R0_9AGAR|nr:hypothetical protein DFP72DRAFT_1170900 [Tulosesus angulatus]